MSDLCTPTFADLAQRMGFSCDDIGGLVSFRNPFGLENWTLLALEILVITGAVLALVYAVNRYRRQGDPTNVVLWFGAIAYLLIIEPPLYFPAAFGIEEHVDTMFAHNLFTVEFLWGRLPLYIVAIYPMMATVSFEIVRRLGVFTRYGSFVGALAVGFVHHAFYEIFDHLGPQLRWWEWTLEHPLNQPFFDSVPLPSVVVFAALWPTSLAFCVQFFVGRHVDGGRSFTGGQIALRTVVVGVLASVGTFILPLPATVSGSLSGSTVVGGVVYALELLALSVVAVAVMFAQWRRLRSPSRPPLGPGGVILGYAAVYLAVMTVLWLTALPDWFGAVGGVTADGDPIGSLWYTVLCLMVAALALAAAVTVRPVASATAEAAESTQAQPQA
ncbi:DUF7802 domain-containing protein [Mycolicibacterium smegmatis]|uniref:DUF7802 domain-containing protein n=2 Tax=Mycolicibacterium smegmatis (strain ATCC 700084 / mc(2)155) TaxID=246196 RepID=A0QU79_MYCS2|nr:hypothetical protein [Mycolicibacterium smegmatis]ABK72578.1 conserved hypothetical protein [Mycolicibacterium smegmatis MC2 155]AFP38533.1 hypothetical protein MSMEI_2062 [Mycolicibacterium smegmatis MC2 155]AIU07316.1 hypothetical protein LJ00_10510 [Mycolicibacterium smegmatis MC2 155]AIU13941.1 hypothetical protein LI99_10510 [Mycolicibacterium smegmatis]AIU20565.1 hypothetical protein LI98_10510 [Mycolicibacterium smegmatis]